MPNHEVVSLKNWRKNREEIKARNRWVRRNDKQRQMITDFFKPSGEYTVQCIPRVIFSRAFENKLMGLLEQVALTRRIVITKGKQKMISYCVYYKTVTAEYPLVQIDETLNVPVLEDEQDDYPVPNILTEFRNYINGWLPDSANQWLLNKFLYDVIEHAVQANTDMKYGCQVISEVGAPMDGYFLSFRKGTSIVTITVRPSMVEGCMPVAEYEETLEKVTIK